MSTTRIRHLTLLCLAVLLAAPLFAAAAESSPVLCPAPPALIHDEQLVTPAPQQKVTCVGYYETDVHWGMGADCTASELDLQDQLYDAADEVCDGIGGVFGPCDETIHITTPCWYKQSTGQYVTDGYMSFGCREW